mgnify:CR=1 FL=1
MILLQLNTNSEARSAHGRALTQVIVKVVHYAVLFPGWG